MSDTFYRSEIQAHNTFRRHPLAPHFSSTNLRQPRPRHYIMVNDHFCSVLRDISAAKIRKLPNVFNPPVPAVTIQCALQAGWTTPTLAPPRMLFLQRRITNPTSDQTPIPAPALHPHRHRHRPPTYRARLLLRGLPCGQTQSRGLPLLLMGQSAAVHSPLPVVSARVRLPVQLLARRHAPVSVAPSLTL